MRRCWPPRRARNVALGAQIIDINMGCPAKKVCNKAAGSALMKDERLVAEILAAVVAAVDVPVTLKIRTGWDRQNKNGLSVARIAEQAGIAALAVHGRTRADLYTGDAEYDTIAAIKQAVSIPVFANGDIDSPHKARAVLAHTGADALLIGRAAQGRPWIFREIAHFLRHRRAAAGTETARGGTNTAGAPGRTACLLRRSHGRSHRPQACRLVSGNAAGRQGVSRPIQSFGQHGRAARQRSRFLRRANRR